MAGTERENPPDDLQVEITDLDHRPTHANTLKRHLTPRLRRWSLALTVVLVVLGVGMILASTVTGRGGLVSSLLQPSPNPSFNAGMRTKDPTKVPWWDAENHQRWHSQGEQQVLDHMDRKHRMHGRLL